MSLLQRILHWGDGTLERTNDNSWSAEFETQIGNYWANLSSVTGASNPRLIDQVWAANRCLQMNASAICTMPLRHYGGREPAWVANPDPNWFPNGIGDAVFSIVWSMYTWGDAFVYVTARYADGFPSAWTVLNPAPITVELRSGRRYYKSSNSDLDADNMVQISRDPRGGLRGTSAIASLSPYTNGLLAAADLGRVMMSTGVPSAVLKSNRKLTEEQAQSAQAKWITATANRRGAPAVLDPQWDFETLSFSPSDLMLLDVQQFSAQVIAAAFGLPAAFINMPIEGGLNYTTPVLGLEQWWRTELRPAAFRISRALSANMLARGSYVEFDAREFLAPGFAEHAETWVAMFEKGLVSQEEARAAVLGLPSTTTDQEVLESLTVPPSAGASPSQTPAEVVALRPTQAVNQ